MRKAAPGGEHSGPFSEVAPAIESGLAAKPVAEKEWKHLLMHSSELSAMQVIGAEYERDGFQPPHLWASRTSFAPGVRERLEQHGLIKILPTGENQLTDEGVAWVMKRRKPQPAHGLIPVVPLDEPDMSAGAREIMLTLAKTYEEKNFPPVKNLTWSGFQDQQAVTGELDALGYIRKLPGGEVRLTEQGKSWIMNRRKRDSPTMKGPADLAGLSRRDERLAGKLQDEITEHFQESPEHPYVFRPHSVGAGEFSERVKQEVIARARKAGWSASDVDSDGGFTVTKP